MSFFNTLASAILSTHADSDIFQLTTDLMPEISTVVATTQCKLALELKPFEAYISNSTRLRRLDETQYNRFDRRRKGFLQSIKFIFQKLSILQQTGQNVQATFKILYESLCVLPSSYLSRLTIAKRISGIEYRKAPCEKTISRAIKVLNQLDMIRVTRRRFKANGKIWDNNFFSLPKWLKTPSMVLLFNGALAASFGVCVPEDTYMTSYEDLKDTSLVIDSVSRVGKSTNIFPKKEEKKNHAPTDSRGTNSREIINPEVLDDRNWNTWKKTKNPFVTYRTYVKAHKKAFDPAKELTTMNFNDVFENSVLDDLVKKDYSTRIEKVKREIVNPGPDGPIFQIIEFICCRIPLLNREFKELLSMPDDLLRIAMAYGLTACNYSAFKAVAFERGFHAGIHKNQIDVLYHQRLREYGINPETFLKVGPVGEFQEKKKGNYVQQSHFRR